jgi:hypothetical protein
MSMKHVIILTGALLLAACGGGDNKEQGITRTVEDGDGNSATIRYGGGDDGIAPPDNLPAFAPIYPGAMIQSAVTGNEGEAKGMVSFLTSAKMADVVAFYREKGKAAGLSVKGEVAMGEGRMLALGGEGDKGMQITVAPSDEGRVMVSVVYDGGKAG